MKTRTERPAASPCPEDPAPAAAAAQMPLRVEAVRDDGRPVDIRVELAGRSLTMLGPGGPRRELDILRPLFAEAGAASDAGAVSLDGLPVLLGCGMGHALHALLERTVGPVAVVEKAMRIWLMPKVITELMDCITMDGSPTR